MKFSPVLDKLRKLFTARREYADYFPEFFGYKCLDLAFSFYDQPYRDALHATGTEASSHLAPQNRANLIAHDTIENSPGLLGVNLILIDLVRILKRFLNGRLGDLIENHASGFGFGDF